MRPGRKLLGGKAGKPYGAFWCILDSRSEGGAKWIGEKWKAGLSAVQDLRDDAELRGKYATLLKEVPEIVREKYGTERLLTDAGKSYLLVKFLEKYKGEIVDIDSKGTRWHLSQGPVPDGHEQLLCSNEKGDATMNVQDCFSYGRPGYDSGGAEFIEKEVARVVPAPFGFQA